MIYAGNGGSDHRKEKIHNPLGRVYKLYLCIYFFFWAMLPPAFRV